MRLTIETYDVAGARQKYTSIMDALQASDATEGIKALVFETATGETVKLGRDNRHQPFGLTYIDATQCHKDEGFEVQTRDREGDIRFFPFVADALSRARRDQYIWKISFPLSGERVRLVRHDTQGHFYLDMMESRLGIVREQLRGVR